MLQKRDTVKKKAEQEVKGTINKEELMKQDQPSNDSSFTVSYRMNSTFIGKSTWLIRWRVESPPIRPIQIHQLQHRTDFHSVVTLLKNSNRYAPKLMHCFNLGSSRNQGQPIGVTSTQFASPMAHSGSPWILLSLTQQQADWKVGPSLTFSKPCLDWGP